MALGKLRLLVIDDDPLVVDTVELCLPDHWTLIARTKDNVNPSEFYHAALVDIHLSGNLEISEGFTVMEKLAQGQPLSEIIAMSGDLRRENMEKALKAGATRFLAKPLSSEELNLILGKIEALWQLRGVSARKDESKVAWIGQSPASEEVRRFIASMKNESAPILLEGESGVGKEVVAQLLHQGQNDRPFVAINVAAINENLFESEFFGHSKGAFTGALGHKAGLVEAAHGGDLFLDEIEALGLPQQAKLLRFLESGEFQRVGSNQVQKVQVRVIAATNENLQKLVDQEKFRADLMFRLSGHRLMIPPLRERREDVGELCQYFFSRREVTLKKSLTPEALEVLQGYNWPGNVRQLKRVCEQLTLLAPLPIVRDEDVGRVLAAHHSQSRAANNLPVNGVDLALGLNGLLEQYERQVLQLALKQDLEVDDLAKLLKISRSSLYKKVKDHNLELKREKG